MSAEETVYAEMCAGCEWEKYCHDNVECCEDYMDRVEELEGEG